MTVVHSPAPPRRSDNYITSRTFEQRGCSMFCFPFFHIDLGCFVVPIYDGRSVKEAREFTFSDADFAKLTTWPLYERGLQDLPYDAVVSVGYTLNTFGEGPRGPNGLSTNLHFVILLALPDDLDAWAFDVVVFWTMCCVTCKWKCVISWTILCVASSRRFDLNIPTTFR